MQKSTSLAAAIFIAALLCGTQVEAFSVYMTRIIIFKDYENGGSPEIGVGCDFGTEESGVAPLPEVKQVNETIALEPALLMDDDLTPEEEHLCLIVEIDQHNDFDDVDADDAENDILGNFTVARSDFVNSFTVKEVEGEFIVRLECLDCEE